MDRQEDPFPAELLPAEQEEGPVQRAGKAAAPLAAVPAAGLCPAPTLSASPAGALQRSPNLEKTE